MFVKLPLNHMHASGCTGVTILVCLQASVQFRALASKTAEPVGHLKRTTRHHIDMRNLLPRVRVLDTDDCARTFLYARASLLTALSSSGSKAFNILQEATRCAYPLQHCMYCKNTISVHMQQTTFNHRSTHQLSKTRLLSGPSVSPSCSSCCSSCMANACAPFCRLSHRFASAAAFWARLVVLCKLHFNFLL
jgi:hypothetical protein